VRVDGAPETHPVGGVDDPQTHQQLIPEPAAALPGDHPASSLLKPRLGQLGHTHEHATGHNPPYPTATG
jgi:hypothetical protein